MSRTIRVQKDIRFVGEANTGRSAGHEGNVQGQMSTALVTFVDDFLGDLLADEWAVDADTGGAAVILAGANGVVNLTTNAADNDNIEMAAELNWYAQQACSIEARLKVDNILLHGMCVGFSDAKSEGDNKMAVEVITGIDTTDNAAEGVWLVYDVDADTDEWHCAATYNTAGATPVVTGVAPVNAVYQTLRIDTVIVNSTVTDAAFYIDGDLVGSIANICDVTVALTPYIAAIDRASSAKRNVHVDYVKCWQNRLESSTVKA